MKKIHRLLVIIILIVLACACDRNQNPIDKNPDVKTEDRVKDLLERMTLDEKIAQLSEARCDNLKEDNKAKTRQFSFDKFKNGVGTIDGFTLSVKEYANAVNNIQYY
ncbi:MAG: hypothetical protein WC220_11425, partial [Pedobacter sp.]